VVGDERFEMLWMLGCMLQLMVGWIITSFLQKDLR
jgi:uncharacterized membrane protein YhdT